MLKPAKGWSDAAAWRNGPNAPGTSVCSGASPVRTRGGSGQPDAVDAVAGTSAVSEERDEYHYASTPSRTQAIRALRRFTPRR